MRFSYVLLVAAVALLATANAVETDTGARSLRAHKTDYNNEERGFSYTFTFSKRGDLFNSLPKQFQRMRKEPSYLRKRFRNWKSVMGSPTKAVEYMRSQGLSQKAIDQFEDAFRSYLIHKRGN